MIKCEECCFFVEPDEEQLEYIIKTLTADNKDIELADKAGLCCKHPPRRLYSDLFGCFLVVMNHWQCGEGRIEIKLHYEAAELRLETHHVLKCVSGECPVCERDIARKT